uniref:Uncharacterized protein n=1 Tax=Anguilla anguilla TaxID=7936 RepID=A0A0E9SJX8_ANGAN
MEEETRPYWPMLYVLCEVGHLEEGGICGCWLPS